MKALFKHIRELFDVPRLHKVISDLEAERSLLRTQLTQAKAARFDNFYEVAKPINLEGVQHEIHERLLVELRPMLTKDALQRVAETFRQAPAPRTVMAAGPGRGLRDEIAAYTVRVDIPAYGARFGVTA